jgi:hypothetical protein
MDWVSQFVRVRGEAVIDVACGRSTYASLFESSGARRVLFVDACAGAVRLAQVCPEAGVVRLDVAGQEFAMVPDQFASMHLARWWIIDIHPGVGRNPRRLVEVLRKHGMHLWWLNRGNDRVEPYPTAADWTVPSTLFARRRGW